MTLLKVLKYPDPLLRNKAEPVETVDASIQTIVKDMFETMYAEGNGVGLAATQVNIPKRIFIMDMGREKKEPHCFINPEITASSGKQTFQEGCLSVPGVYGKVERAKQVHLKALNEKGEPLEMVLDGFKATCVQHEIDHLDGVLFVDKLSRLKRTRLLDKYKKLHDITL